MMTLIQCLGILLVVLSQAVLAQDPKSSTPAVKPNTPTPASSPATQPAPNPGKNIRFQFDGIPYADVLERFAQMANKPLLADTNIQGTLTYNDPNPYTYNEALDTLNLILSMKGLMVIESGHNLRLVPFKELPAMPLRIMRGTDSTGDVRPGEVVTVVLDVQNIDAKEVGDAVTSMLSNAGSVAPLSRGRGLIITDRLANIQRIRTLLATIDTEATVDRQMKTYNLLHSSGSILSDLLNRTFGVATAPKRTQYNPNTKQLDVLPPDPNDYITSVYDEASRTMVLFGPRERIGLAEELINKFEQRDGAGGDVRIYYPQSIKPEELANIIRQAVPGVAAPNETAAAAATKARLITDPQQNRLIVAAPIPGQLDQIEQLINRVDKNIHGQAGQPPVPMRTQTIQLTKVFRPRATDATNVAAILTQALTRRASSGQITTTASVSFDAGSQSVVLSGSPGDIQIATDIISQLETGSTQPTPMQTRFIDVGSPNEAKRLTPLVEQLYKNQVSDGTVGATAHARIMPDLENGRLIVTANEDHLSRIEALIVQLRGEKTQVQPRRLQIIPVKNVRVETATTSITTLVNERMSEKRFANEPKPSIIPDAPNNRMLVTATDDQIREIEQIISIVDVAPVSSPKQFKSLELYSRNVAELTPLIQQLYTEQLRGQPEVVGGPATLMPESRENRIMVSGTEREISRVEAIVRQLDPEGKKAAKDETRVIRLRTASAPDIVGIIEKTLNAQQQKVRVLVDARSNSLIMSGDPEAVAAASTVVDQLDTRGELAPRELRVLELKSAEASTVAPMLNNLFTEMLRDKRGADYNSPTKIVPDVTANRIIVTGIHDEIEQVASLVQRLDQAPEQAPGARVYKLGTADATMLAPIVSNAMLRFDTRGQSIRRVTVTADEKSNSLIVSGTRSDVQDAGSVIEKLDGETGGRERILKIFDVQSSDPDALAALVNKVFAAQNPGRNTTSMVHITPEPASKRLIVLAPVTLMAQVQVVIESLDAKPDQIARELHSVDLKNGNAAELMPKVSQIYAEQSQGKTIKPATLYPDPSGSRLMVYGTKEQSESIRQIVSTFESVDRVPRETRSFDLGRLAEAQRLMPLAQQLYRDQIASLPQSGAPDAQMISDGKTGRILVSARADQMKLLEEVFSKLQTNLVTTTSQSRETRTFEVGTAADVQRLLPLVQQLYTEQWKDRSETDPADAQIVPDLRGGRLLATGKPEHLKQIEAIIQQLGVTKAKPEARETKIFDLSTASAVDLAVTVRTLYTEQAKARLGSSTPDTLITPDAGGNRLIVVGDKTELAEVEDIIKKLDKVSAQSSTARVFKIKSAEPEKVAEILTASLIRYDAYGRPQKRATVSVDGKSRTLIVTGDPKELQSVSVIIEQLDTSLGAQPERKMKVVSLTRGKAADLSPKVRQLYADQIKGRPELSTSDFLLLEDVTSNQIILAGSELQLQVLERILADLQAAQTTQSPRETKMIDIGQPTEIARLLPLVQQLYQDRWRNRDATDPADAQIIPDTPNGRIILTARTNHIVEIEQIIQQLRTSKSVTEPRATRIFELGQSEDVTRLQPMIQQMYSDLWRGRESLDPADAQMIPDLKNGRLIVTARTNHIVAIEEILERLANTQNQTGPRDTRVYDLSSTSASELSENVRSLYREQLRNRPPPVGGAANIMADQAANRLIVSGSTNELSAVESIIEKLDKVSAKTGGTRVFPLKNALADQVSSVLSTALVTLTPYGTRVPRVSVGADNANNLVIVNGEPKDLQSAAVIVEQMDSVATRERRQMRLLNLKSGTASEVAGRVRQLYQDQLKGTPGQGQTNALILGDEVSNRLIVTATDAHLKLIEEILNQLQQSTDAAGTGRQLRVLPLQNQPAQAVAALLTQLYPRQTESTDPGEKLVVKPLADDRSLVVEASTLLLDRVEQAIKTLDQSQTNGPSVIQTVHLKKGRAEDLAEAVTKSIASRDNQSPLRRVGITPVVGANTLLLNGPTNGVQEVIKLLGELDNESEPGGIDVRIYKLENGNVREIQGVIQQLMLNTTRALGLTRRNGRDAMANVSIDERANSLVVSGLPAHFQMIEKVLPTLDKAPERSDRDVQFIWLRKAKAYDVVDKLVTLFEDRPSRERPVIEADSANNSITVIAKRGDIAQIQDLVSRLDDQSKDNAFQVRLRPLDRVAADKMAKMLENIYPQMAQGKIRVVDRVPSPVPGLPLPLTPQNLPQPNAPAPQGAPAPAGGQPQATTANTNALEVVISVDQNANALILSGPAQELDNIDRIITELTFNFFSNESEFRLFPLKDADPVVVARTLTDLLRPESMQPNQQGQQRNIQAQPPKITVVAEPRTRHIIVRARPTDFALLESLIKQLDSAGQATALEFRSIQLTNAAPEKVLPLVQQMVSQLNLVRPGEPLTVTLDSRNHGLMVIARDSLLQQVEKMIRSLDTPANNVEAEVLMISLKRANAAQLAVVLQNMLRPGTAGELTTEARELQEQIRRLKVQNDAGQTVTLDLAKPIKIAADGPATGNRLVLTSTPDNLKALAAVVAMMDTASLIEGVEIRLSVLQYADASTVSQTLTTIFTQGRALSTGPAGPGAQPEGPAGKALVNPLNIAVDARSNTLILSGQRDTLDLALKVVADLDKQLDRFVTEVRLFRLKHASAIRLLPLLQSVFAEGPNVPGTEGLSTQITRLRTVRGNQEAKTSLSAKNRTAITVQADELSNILIIAARSDTLPLIQDVIEELDIPAASGLETVRIYPLNHADPLTIQRILNELFTGPRSTNLRNEDKPIITVDDRTSALVIAGNSKAFGVVEGLLQQLDQKLAFDLRDIRLIPLQNSDAVSVAATLQRLMDARLTQKATLNRGTADSLKVIIMADSRSNSLLVGGSKDSFETVEALAKQLDTAAPALSGQVRLIPITFADARVLSATFTTLFEQRYAAARSSDVARNKPIIMADPRSNSLMVTANQEDNRTIDDLLKKLDAKMDNPALTLTVIPLKHNDAARVGTTIESIFAARTRAQLLPGQSPLPSDQIKLEPDALNNALIVSASKENLELIQSLLTRIDVEPTVAGGVIETFALQFADAQRVATILKTLVDQGLYKPGVAAGAAARSNSGRDALALTVDPRSNTLIVSASPENLAIVREVIKKVDSKDFTEAGNVKLYPLKNAKAGTLANTLEQFFRAKRAGDAVIANAAERTIPVSVIPDERMNTLLVTGGKEAFDLADRVIQQLDGEGVFSRLNFRVFPLKKATATKLQQVLQQIFANRPPKIRGEPLDPITIVADSWVNGLLVGASVEDMGTVESMIKQLDNDPAESGIAVHFFPLAKADARRVAQTVQSLFREGNPGTTLPVTVSSDDRINAIVVSCGEVDAKRIEELVKKLDTEQVARVSEIKVFPLKYARAESLSSILNTSLNTKPAPLTEQNPNAQSVLQFITRTEEGRELVTAALKEAVLITPDSRMNSLIVSGPVDYMGLLEQIISRLDASSPQQAQIKVFTLQNADARQMAELLMSLFRMTPSGSAPTGSARSVNYTLLAPKLDAAGNQVDNQELASATVGTAEQSALNVTIDPRTNSLLVGGTEHYVDLVSQIIQSLDASPANERKTEVMRLKNSQAQEVATAVRNFLDQERQRVTQVLGADALGTAQRMLEREVAVVAEPVSNTLLVSANPRYFEQMRALIDELDRPQSQVLIQVLLAEVTLDGVTDLGVEWSHNGRKGDVDYGIGTDFDVAKQLTDFGGFSTAVSGSDFSFLLRALKNEGRLEILSRPQIVTADNKPATINVGQRVPLLGESRLTANENTVTSIRYEEIGVSLSVTPKISPDGFVKMDIGTTNSSLSSLNLQLTDKTSAPVINNRRANTAVSVQSGQTIIIGGLIGTTDDKRVKKMPILGDIPVLGALFRSTKSNRERKELMILLTPQVLSKDDSRGKLRSVNEVTREQLDHSRMKDELKRDELQKQILDPLFPDIKTNNAVPTPDVSKRPNLFRKGKDL